MYALVYVRLILSYSWCCLYYLYLWAPSTGTICIHITLRVVVYSICYLNYLILNDKIKHDFCKAKSSLCLIYVNICSSNIFHKITSFSLLLLFHNVVYIIHILNVLPMLGNLSTLFFAIHAEIEFFKLGSIRIVNKQNQLWISLQRVEEGYLEQVQSLVKLGFSSRKVLTAVGRVSDLFCAFAGNVRVFCLDDFWMKFVKV